LKDGNWVYYWLNPDKHFERELKGKETWKVGKMTSQEQIITKDELNKSIEQDPNQNNGGGEPGGQ
jgi:hypothetical protein